MALYLIQAAGSISFRYGLEVPSTCHVQPKLCLIRPVPHVLNSYEAPVTALRITIWQQASVSLACSLSLEPFSHIGCWAARLLFLVLILVLTLPSNPAWLILAQQNPPACGIDITPSHPNQSEAPRGMGWDGMRWDRCSSKTAVCCHHTSTTCANLRGPKPQPAQSQAFAQLALANLAAFLQVWRASRRSALRPPPMCLLPGRPDAHEPLPPKRPMARQASKCTHSTTTELRLSGLIALLLPPLVAAASRRNLLDQAEACGKASTVLAQTSASRRSIASNYGCRRERCCSRSAGPWRKRRAPMPCRAGSMAAASAASLSEAVDLHRRLS
ncbi:hypothetical protein TgHK011_007315 [Trichoderma gracile]|nr:hypothetical protein TgHK011_007315 [Trichoderma gracile]